MAPSRLGMTAYSAGVIDLGSEPPLVLGAVEEEVETIPAPRAISWRWMTGTVLTGLTSIALMGTALIVAVSSPIRFASLPESLIASAIDAGDVVFGRKGDRLHPTEEPVSNRQVIQVSTVTRQGERDFIKLKPFVKVNASLLSANATMIAEVPKYDPLAIFADNTPIDDNQPAAGAATTAVASDDIFAAPVDGEVSTRVVDFPLGTDDLDPAVTLGDQEVEQIVRATAHLPIGDGTEVALTDATDDAGPADGVRIVPENVSNVAKSADGLLFDDGYQEKMIAVDKPENLRQLFADNGIDGDDADEIVAALSQLTDVSRLRPGQKVRIGYAADPETVDQPDVDADPAADASAAAQKALRPIRVSIYADGAHQATVARADSDVFVRADEPSLTPEVFAKNEDDTSKPDDGGPQSLYTAVYATALEQQIPKPLIDGLIRIFAYDVDLNQRVGLRDSIQVFHSLADPTDGDSASPEILYASLNLGGAEKRFYRFRTPDDGVIDYYDEDGHSAKKFLVRKPLPTGHITSTFGWRVHPILGYRRLHAGVDYGAPRGTPIFAAGDGVVERAGGSSGYGNLTVIKHTNGYETFYGHQSKFAKGIAPGVHVHQGQVIGYVGSTGLSTGPHLHFEIRVNGKAVDPLRIRLPRGRVLEGDMLTAFEHERERVDQLLGNDQQSTNVASLDTDAVQ